ncbi:MAG: hypothetical protein QOC78_2101 [Solirubrobacteraceae bacterium]|jgi:hypothetical protein|nr:hypothetical protein [Solirubrobacteraceae bacterium]
MLLIDTRDHHPERPERPQRRPLWLDVPELRPWRWFLCAIVLFVVSESLDGWPGLIPLFVGFGCVLWGLTSYYQGNDGMRNYRQ